MDDWPPIPGDLPPSSGGRDPKEDTADLDEVIVEDVVETLPPTVTPDGERKGRWIRVDEAGNRYLVITQRTKLRPKRWKKATVRYDQFELLLTDNSMVNESLAKRLKKFSSVPGEDAFLIFMRLHWWSHGPAQIGCVLMVVMSTLGYFWLLPQLTDNRTGLAVTVAWICVLALCGLAYLYVWLPWNYHYLIVTNLRVMLVYEPPFGLPGEWSTLSLKDILSVNTIDQSKAKFLPAWGNLLEKLGFTGYKILAGDSAAQVGDEWFRDGIYYVPNAEEVEAILSSARAALDSVDGERHEEDMDFQRRQAEASERAAVAAEETRDMWRRYMESNSQ